MDKQLEKYRAVIFIRIWGDPEYVNSSFVDSSYRIAYMDGIDSALEDRDPPVNRHVVTEVGVGDMGFADATGLMTEWLSEHNER